MKKLFFLMMLLMLINCEKEGQIYDTIKKEEDVKKSDSLKSDSLKTETPLSKEETFKDLNREVLQVLKVKQYAQFANHIHPEKGVRFSMYAFVNPAKDKIFTKEDFLKYIDSETKFTWGERDGTGEPLVLSINDYLQKWVFKKDFDTASEYYFNDFKASGNSLNNLKKLYPNANFTENFIAGTEENSGLDWASLRLVFEESAGNNYLVAVINDEWTI